MKYILAEDAAKFIPTLTKVISVLGNGAKNMEAEDEITLGDESVIVNVKGCWFRNAIRIDIKFRS